MSEGRDHDRRHHRDRPGRDQRAWTESAPSQRRKRTDPARLAAYEGLRAVHADDAYANLVFPHILRNHHLHGRDAAFATELFYGTLRAQGRLERILMRCSNRPWRSIDENVRDVLLLGAHQLIDMSVAPHAATSETVGLGRLVTGAGSAQFINAVLRHMGERSGDEWLEEILGEISDPVERLAVEYSHPAWIVRALGEALTAHGRDRSELPDLLASQNVPPKVDLVIRPGLCDLEELEQFGASDGRLSIYAAQWPSGDPSGIDPVREGRAAIQDEGSQLVAGALGEGTDDLVLSDTGHWLDLCAGPGGKAALLAGFTLTSDADLLAIEVAEHRADLVRRGLRALVSAGAEVEVSAADGRKIGAEYPDRFDRVLADVPCTGLGALRRRPEARWRRSPKDVGALTKLQRELLDSAIDAAAPGGVVAYATCSPHLAETLVVVADALRRRHDVEQLDARPAVRAVLRQDAQDTDLGSGPAVQLWPHVHGTDAMFVALLRKLPDPRTTPDPQTHREN